MTIPGYMGMDLPILEQAVITWHNDRNLINGSTDQAQLAKYQTADAIGDVLVVLINIAKRNGLDLRVCLHRAYNEIKDREGKLIDGIYIKEEQLD